MPSATGTSIRGLQSLLVSGSAPSKLLSVAITSSPVPPVKRYGYFYLYQYKNAAPFQSFVVEEGLMRAPGLFIPIRLSLVDATYNYRLDVVWNVVGVTWQAVIS